MTTETDRQDKRNAEFWDALCGWSLAQSMDLTGDEPEDLRRFDEAYLAYYPYLADYVAREPLAGRPTLEIGLGFGTLGRLLADAGADYHGLDVAAEPVALMRRRLGHLEAVEERVRQGTALQLPYDDGRFDFVYSIGCLHHTGDLPRAVGEVQRVLAPGGRAVVMLYNARSFRQLIERLRSRMRRDSHAEAKRRVAAIYDTNPAGATPPHTEYVTRKQVRDLFAGFGDVRIEARNFDDYALPRVHLRRAWMLGNVDRIAGLDLYITATR